MTSAAKLLETANFLTSLLVPIHGSLAAPDVRTTIEDYNYELERHITICINACHEITRLGAIATGAHHHCPAHAPGTIQRPPLATN